MKSACTLVLAALLALPVHAQILEQVLVKVNGEIISKTDLEDRQIAALRDSRSTRIDADSLQTDEGLRKALAEITPQLLVAAIDEILMLQLGRERGYRLTDDQFKEWLADIRKEQNLLDDAKFEAVLKQEGMTLTTLRSQLERQVIISQVQRADVGAKLQITEEEARQYYQANRSEFVEPATATFREILLELPAAAQGAAGVNVAADDEVREQAEAIRARAVGGEDFAKLVAEASASATKANGGLIGPLNVSDLSPALQAMLETMKPGDITQPLRAAKGYQILKVETLSQAAPQAFDRVRDLVADRVHEARQQTEIRRFLARLRGQALIEWKNQDLKKAYEQHLSTLATGSTGL
jgi:peptidyl-prolyl cis-trans isomerase SurA